VEKEKKGGENKGEKRAGGIDAQSRVCLPSRDGCKWERDKETFLVSGKKGKGNYHSTDSQGLRQREKKEKGPILDV